MRCLAAMTALTGSSIVAPLCINLNLEPIHSPALAGKSVTGQIVASSFTRSPFILVTDGNIPN